MTKPHYRKLRMLSMLVFLPLLLTILAAGVSWATFDTTITPVASRVTASPEIAGSEEVHFKVKFDTTDPVTFDASMVDWMDFAGCWASSGSCDSLNSIFNSVYPDGTVCLGNSDIQVNALTEDPNGQYEIVVKPRRNCLDDHPVTVRINAGPAMSVPAEGDPDSNNASNVATCEFDDAPHVLITPISPADTNSPTIYFQFQFSDPVTDFGTGDVTVHAPTAGYAGGTKVQVVSGSGEPGEGGSIFTAAISGMTYSGMVEVSLAQGKCQEMGSDYLGSVNWSSDHDSCSTNFVNSDLTAPTITPGVPSAAEIGSYSTSLCRMDISGTASDDVAVVSVAWSNDRGGSGTCTGTTSWSQNGIYLQPGLNAITVTASDAAGNTASYVISVNCTSGYLLGDVDTPADAEKLGEYCSLALDGGGNPGISYYESIDSSFGALRFAAWDGSAWAIEDVDGNSLGSVKDDVGCYTSLKFDDGGNPHVSYYDVTNGDLMYATRSSGSWLIADPPVDGTSQLSNNAGQYSSLALYHDLPRIAYYVDDSGLGTASKRLAYSVHNGSAWTRTWVDYSSGIDLGKYASLAVDSVYDNPQIAYYDATGRKLKYAWSNDHGTNWTSVYVDSSTDWGQYCSIALDPNTSAPRISFYDATNKRLKYAAGTWTDDAHTGVTWAVSTIDSTNDVGKYSSISVDASGLPRIAYYDATNKDLKYAIYDGSAWTTTTLDDPKAEAGANTYDVGQYASLALDSSGGAHIGYYDATNTALKYIRTATGPTCYVTAQNTSPTNTSPLTFQVIFSSAVTGFGAGDVDVTGGVAGTPTEISPNDGTTYRVLVTPTVDGTVSVSVPEGAARQQTGTTTYVDNQASNVASVVVDRTKPDVVIDQDYTGSDPSNASAVYFSAVFSEPVTGFDTTDVSISGSAGGVKVVTVTGVGTHYRIAVSGMTSAGAVVASISANRAVDAVGNYNNASTSTDNTVWWDGVPPTCTINQAAGLYGGPTQDDPTKSTTIHFTAAFSEPVRNFYAVSVGGSASFTDATGQSTLSVTISSIGDPDASGHYSTYDVAVSGMRSKGTVTCTIPARSAFDCSPSTGALINGNVASTSDDNVVTYDATPPTVTITKRADQAASTTTLPIRYSVVFSKDVTGFTSSDVQLSGTANLSGAVVTVSGSGKEYTVEVSGIQFPSGTTAPVSVTAYVPAGVAQDAQGNTNLAATAVSNTVYFDNVGPNVTVEQASTQADSTLDAEVHFTVVFTEAVSGFNAEKVTLGGTAPDAQASVSQITPNNGTTYDISVTDMSDMGSVTASVAAGVVADALGNTNTASTSVDNRVTYFPERCISQQSGYKQVTIPAGDPNGITSELDMSDVSGIITDLNVSLQITQSVAKELSAYLMAPDGTEVELFSGLTASGANFYSTVLDDEAAQAISTGVPPYSNYYKPKGLLSTMDGHQLTGTWTLRVVNAAGTHSGYLVNWCLQATIEDDAKPICNVSGPSAATNLSPIDFSITFDEPVRYDLTIDGITVTGGTPGSLSGTGTSYVLPVTPAGDGLVTVTVAAGAVHDTCGNPNDETSGTVVSDLVQPYAVITPVTSSPTNASPIVFSVAFSEVVTNFMSSALALSGSAGATDVSIADTGDGQHYTLTVTGMTSPGVVTVSLLEDAVPDLAGNLNRLNRPNDEATVQFTGVLCTVSGPTSPTRVSPIEFTITFNTAVDSASFLLKKSSILVSGGLAQTLTMSDSAAKYKLLVAPSSSGPITVTCQVPSGLAKDPVTGNSNSPSNTASITYDATRVAVQIDQASTQADPTNSSPVKFRAVFSKAVSDFASSDVTISGSAGGTKTVTVTDTGDARTYDITVSGMTSDGTVIASIASDVAHDAGGNGNDKSLSTDNTVVYDSGRPSVTINQASSQSDPTNQSQVTFSVVFSEAVTGFTSTDVTVNCSDPLLTPTVTLSDSTDQKNYSLVVGGLTSSCTVTASISANVCQDGAGNANTASSSSDNTISVDLGAPTVTICQADGQDDPTNTSPILFSVAFSKAVTGFTASDVTITGTAAGKKTITVVDSGDHQNYSVRVSGMTCPAGSTLPGTVIATIAAGAATDSAGNASKASNDPYVSCDNEISYDNSGPKVTVAQAADQDDSTWGDSVAFVVTFGEEVGDFTTDDLAIGGTALYVTEPVITVENPTGDRKTYNVTVSGFDTSVPGNVTVSVAAGAAHDDAGNGNVASTSTDNSVTYFREQCSTDVPKDIPDNDSTGVESTLDLTGYSGLLSDVDVVLDIEHEWDQDLTATLISPAGTRVVLFSNVGGVGTNRANFSGTLLADEAATAITAGQAPFSSSGGYRPEEALSALNGENITGLWTLVVDDGTAGNTGRIVSWCMRMSIADSVVPTGVIAGPDGSACASPIEFDVAFSEPVVGLTAKQFTATGGTVAGLDGSGASYVLYVTPSADGTVSVSLGAGKAHDTCGNFNATEIKGSATYDGPPSVTIDQAAAQADPTGTSPVNFSVVFGKSVTGFTGDDVVVDGTAFAPGDTKTAVVTGSGKAYNVAVSGMSLTGTVTASVPADVASSVSNGCPNVASTSTDAVVDYDITAVTVTINTAPGQDVSTGTLPINFSVHFSKTVVDFAASGVTISGTAGGTKSVAVTGSGQDYTVAVSGVTSSGTVIASIPANAAHDALGNGNAASTSTSNEVWFDDGTDPVAAVVAADGQADPAKDAPVNFTVTFSKIVTGFGDEDSDVEVSGTAFGPGSTKDVVFTDNGDSWNVAISGMDQPGTVIVSVPAGVACDPSSKCNGASAEAEVSFDNEGPSVTIEQSADQLDPIDYSPIMFTVEFSEPVTGFMEADVAVTGSAFGVGAIKTVEVTGGPSVYDIAVSGMSTTGTVYASIPASVAQDAAGNWNSASTSSDNGVTYDEPPSVVVEQAGIQEDPTGTSPVLFDVTFSEAVVGFDESAVSVDGTAFGLGATPVVTWSGSGAAYEVAVSGMSESGTVVVSIPAGVVKDVGGNGNLASTSTDNVVAYDVTRPEVTVSQAEDQADPTKSAAINFTAVFTKPVSDFASGDVTISKAAFGSSTPTVSVTGGPTTFNIAVSGMNTTGDVVASIAANVAHDSVGNGNTASAAADNQVTYDITGPSVTINKAAEQADPTNSSPVNFTVVFSEPVTGFESDDVVLSGTAGATTAVVTEATSPMKYDGATTYDVAVSGMTGVGTVIATIPAGSAQDSLGNLSAASTSTDNEVAYDSSALTVTINQASNQLDPTNSGPLKFTAVFSKSVDDFASGDVTVGGTAGGTKTVTVTGSGTTYSIAVSGLTSTGTVTPSIAAGVAHDEAGNANAEATYTDRTVTYDITAPTIAITKPTADASCSWNVYKLKIGGTATDSVAMGTVMWSAAKGGSGLCTGTTTWSATGIDIADGSDTFTVTATDAAGNKTTDTIAVTVVPALPADDDWSGLAMVSLPIIPYDTDPKVEVGFYSDYWVSYDPTAGAYSKYPTSATWFNTPAKTPGRGFWAGFSGTATDPVGMVPSQTGSVTIHLLAGWNLIGQPFIESVAWDTDAIMVTYGSSTRCLADAKVLGWVKDYAWGWEPDKSSSAGGAYYLVCDPALIPGAIGELAPWRAFWLKASVECDLVIPAP